MKKIIINNEKGFALLAALIACLILIAIGVLVLNMSTGDLLTSSAAVGNKKALAAAESGISKLINDVDPDNWNVAHNYSIGSNCGADTFSDSSYTWLTIPGGTDTHTQFAVCQPLKSQEPPIPVQGGELGGGGVSHDNPQGYIYRYDSTVVGKNTSYNSQSKVGIGVGFGPI
jgi:hypothetical protein